MEGAKLATPDESGQAKTGFLKGCHLPAAWQDKNRFVILETGFGSGLDFLATWEAFRQHPGRCQTLHFIAVEAHPLSVDALEHGHATCPELALLASALRRQWPVLVAGYHRLSFDDGRVQLTLIFDGIQTALKQLDVRADAIFLKTIEALAWTTGALKQLSRRAAVDARLTTRCVDKAMRLSLQEAGFTVQHTPGLTLTHEHLEAVYAPVHFTPENSLSGNRPLRPSATLIGAGMAGVCLAHALVQRGWQVTLIEQHRAPAMGASGNPAGIVRPQLVMDDSLNGRLSRQAFLHTVKLISSLPTSHPPHHAFNGVLHLARDSVQAQHMQAMLAAHGYPQTFARWADQTEASTLAGVQVTGAGLYFPQGGWISGPLLAQALLNQCGEKLTHRFSCTATRLQRTEAGWCVWENDVLLAESTHVILTGAHEAMQFTRLPLRAMRGQITTLADGSLPALNIPVTREGYVLPTQNGIGNIGASFVFDDDPAFSTADQQANLQKLADMLRHPPALDASALAARVSFRAATPDRLPLIGAIADEQLAFPPDIAIERIPRQAGLYAMTGLGARGLVWAPFVAQALAAKLDGEPWWLPQDLWRAVDPARFLLRDVRRTPPERKP